MPALTNYAVEAILADILRGVAHGLPATMYVGLSTSDPGETGDTSGEPSGNGYARVGVDRDTAEWTDPGAGNQNESDNVEPVAFPTPTGTWGTISHVFVADDPTAGEVWIYGALSAVTAIDENSSAPQIESGGLNFRLDYAS